MKVSTVITFITTPHPLLASKSFYKDQFAMGFPELFVIFANIFLCVWIFVNLGCSWGVSSVCSVWDISLAGISFRTLLASLPLQELVDFLCFLLRTEWANTVPDGGCPQLLLPLFLSLFSLLQPYSSPLIC